MQNKTKSIVSLILNIVIIAMVSYSITMFLSGRVAGFMKDAYKECFKYFTNLSNIFCALTCAYYIPSNIRQLKGKTAPFYSEYISVMGTVGTTITLIVVLTFLGPLMGYKNAFGGVCLYLHLLVPVLAAIKVIFFEQNHIINYKKCLKVMILVALYGVTYLLMVIILKQWNDFYMFNAFSGMWIIVYIIIGALTFAVIYITVYLKNLAIVKLNKNIEKK